jgi:hypothetical protein
MIYEYVAVYMDNLLIAAQDSSSITKALGDWHQFKFQVTGPLQYHLGCDYFKDNTGTLGPIKYIKRMIRQYACMIGNKTKEYTSPLKKAYHPEIELKVFQFLIGSLLLVILLQRSGIQMANVILSCFCEAPNKGNLENI